MIGSKRLLRSKPVQVVLAWLAAQYIRLLYLTTQWTVVCPPTTESCLPTVDPSTPPVLSPDEDGTP